MLDLLEECRQAQNIAISGHIHPDGDCVGSNVAMALYLRKVYPEKRVDVFLEPFQDIFLCLKGAETVITDFTTNISSYDVMIIIDCARERIGKAADIYKSAKKTINIDHHISNQGGSGLCHIVPDASSSSELVYNLIEEEYLDKDIAKALYLGIAHDTGVFQYSSTSPSTYMAAARLISYGFDFSKLIDETYFEKTYVQNRILGKALVDSVLHFDGRVISTVITNETLKEFNADNDDLEGIASQLRVTVGVECSIFIYQLPDYSYKVSLRASSDTSIDVSKVGEHFGGGGHVKAAGATFRKGPEEILNELLAEIEKQL